MMESLRKPFNRWDWQLALGQPPDPRPEAALTILDQIKGQVGSDPARIGVIFDYRETGEATAQAKLEMAAFDRRLPWTFFTVDFNDGGGAAECKQRISESIRHNRYLLIGPAGEEGAHSIRTIEECAAWVIEQARANDLGRLGLKLEGEATIPRKQQRPSLHFSLRGGRKQIEDAF